LATSSASFLSTRIEIFRQGLHELGYVEGKNIAVEYRFADGKTESLPELVAELVSLKVEIIVTTP
jgi:putative tryptophan/tyrosine transport system substrate-binding protein